LYAKDGLHCSHFAFWQAPSHLDHIIRRCLGRGVSDYSLRVTTKGSSTSYPFLSGVSAGQTSIAFSSEDTIVVTLQGHVTIQKFTNRIQMSPSREHVLVFLQIE
jgi:hypothetical protein